MGKLSLEKEREHGRQLDDAYGGRHRSGAGRFGPVSVAGPAEKQQEKIKKRLQRQKRRRK